MHGLSTLRFPVVPLRRDAFQAPPLGLLLVLFVHLLLLFPTWSATYYVSSSTGSDEGPGTRGQPWRTHAAVHDKAGPGDIVLYRRGDFFPGTLTPPPGLKEIGAYGLIHRPPVFVGPEEVDALLQLTSDHDGIQIHDIRFIRYTRAAIDVSGTSDVRISYVDISYPDYGHTTYAIRVHGDASLTLSHASIYGCDLGVWAANSGSVTVEDSLFLGCRNQALYNAGSGSISYENTVLQGCGATSGNLADRTTYRAEDAGNNTRPDHLLHFHSGWPRQPAIALQVDDVYDQYADWVRDTISSADAAGHKLDLSVICYDIDALSPDLVSWSANGHVTYSHGWGSQRSTYYNGFQLQFLGNDSCFLHIADGRLWTEGCGGNTLDYDYNDEDSTQFRIGKLCSMIASNPDYTCSLNTYTSYSTPSLTLQDVDGRDISEAPYDAVQTQERLVHWDYWLCRDKLQRIGSVPSPAFVWPAGLHDHGADTLVRRYGFSGARNAGGQGQPPLEVGYDLFAVDGTSITELIGASMETKRRLAADYASCRAVLNKPGVWYLHPFSGMSPAEVGDVMVAIGDAGVGDTSLDEIVNTLRKHLVDEQVAREAASTEWIPVPTRRSLLADRCDRVPRRHQDIRGLPLHGRPDIGAYESVAGGNSRESNLVPLLASSPRRGL